MEEHPYTGRPIEHVHKKSFNNRIESDHAALKRLIKPCKGFRSLRTAKSTLMGIEAFRTIKRGDILKPTANPADELRLVSELLGIIPMNQALE